MVVATHLLAGPAVWRYHYDYGVGQCDDSSTKIPIDFRLFLRFGDCGFHLEFLLDKPDLAIGIL